MWHDHDGMGWWMLFAGVLWLLFWSSIVWLIVVAVTRGGAGRQSSQARAGEPEDPLQIARRRLANGDITAQEFEVIVAHLSHTAGSP
jgi:uncharacterized membrane protein